LGVGPIALTLYAELAKQRLLKPGQYVFELGSQEIFVEGWRGVLKQFCAAMALPLLSNQKWESARDLMEALGFHYTSADLDGRFGAQRVDLNKPWDSIHAYDVVTNHGTTEHCFDQGECFRTIHKATRVGGLMIHCVPTQGYVKHCFFLYEPEFFHALAAANCYDEISLRVARDAYEKPSIPIVFQPESSILPGNVLLCVVLRKIKDADFVPPIQEFYRV